MMARSERAPRRSAAAGGTAGELVYAIGDVHGSYELLKELLAAVARDYASRAKGRRPILIFLGDYIDRGPQSTSVLETLLWLQRRNDIETHLLKGNHEQGLLAFVDSPQEGAAWLRFGGVETLGSYGVAPPELEKGPQDYVRARDELLEAMPASHLRLLQRLELMAIIGDYAFVHAGIRPGTALKAQTERDLLWIREGFLDHPQAFEKIIVHGHTWLGEDPQMLANRIGVDTGAFATGVLTALRLDDGQRGILQAGRRAQWHWAPPGVGDELVVTRA
jgi:serine/threonine protein phosphatase 1